MLNVNISSLTPLCMLCVCVCVQQRLGLKTMCVLCVSVCVQQRLGLKTRHEVGVQLEVGKGIFSKPTRVQPAKLPDGRVLPGAGLERKAVGRVPAKVIRVLRLDKD